VSEIKYYKKIQIHEQMRNVRYHMVRYALKNGIKPTARVFKTTPRTVRKWIRRWKEGSHEGLIDRRSLPYHRASKIPHYEYEKAVRIKKILTTWGALRVKQNFGLNISDKAIRKIWRKEKLIKPRKTHNIG